MISAICSYIDIGYMGEGVSFSGTIKGEKRNRHIAIHVGPEKIKAIANALQHTDSVPHAAWHAQHPDSALPCSTCRKT